MELKGFPFPSSNCYLCCQLKLFTWFVLGDESKPQPIHISHRVHINWCFTSQGLPKEAPVWSLNNLTTIPFSPPLFLLVIDKIHFFFLDVNLLPEVSQIAALGHRNLISEAERERKSGT